MTDSHTTDQRIRAWLDLMPSEAPERAVQAVLQAVEVTPQQRPPLRLAVRRPTTMNRLALAATAVVAVLVIASSAYLLTRSTQPAVGGTPIPTALASPSASAAGQLPTNLVGAWLGPPRPIGGTSSRAGVVLRLDSASVALTTVNAPLPLLSADASISGSTLRVTTAGAAGRRCGPADVGTYPVTLSDSGLTLTVAAGADACRDRASALEGAWSRSACRTDQDTCLGQLEPGAHDSQFFESFLAHGVVWEPVFGGLQYSVAGDWTNDQDWPSAYDLGPTADVEAAPVGSDPARSILVLSNAMAESQARPCSGTPDTGAGPGVDGFLNWLRDIPGIQLGRRSTETINGHPATAVDVQLTAAPTGLCNGTDPVVQYLMTPGWSNGNGGASDSHVHGLDVGAEDRLILVDGGGGDLIAIVVQVADAKDFAAFVADAEPIVHTFRFPDSFPGG